MLKLNKVSYIIPIICLSALILSGCGSRMFNKAVEQGKLSIASMEYEKAKASFELALEEKNDEEVKSMLEKVDNMLAGIRAKENNDIETAIQYLSNIVDDQTLPSMAQQATQMSLELQRIKDKIDYYALQLVEAKSMVNDKKYSEGKIFLAQLIEETKDQTELLAEHEKAKNLLGQIHSEVSQMETQRKEIKIKAEEEAARLAELERQKRVVSNAQLIDILLRGTQRMDDVFSDGFTSDGSVLYGDFYVYPFLSQFNTKAKVESYLNPYISKNVIQYYIELFTVEKNGLLYANIGDGGYSLYDNPQVTERSENGDVIRITLSYYLFDGYTTSSVKFIYKNGNWLIDSHLEAASG